MSGRVVSRFGPYSTAAEVAEGVDLAGRAAIVTGGASGIGVETARVLASRGAAVTIAVRNLSAGHEVAGAINAEIGAERVSAAPLELGRLASVRAFAESWGARPLHLLINNAGVMACPQAYTEDGFEMQFGVNHLGHFLLTMLLVPALKRGAPGRLVSVSSSAHQHSGVVFDDPHFRQRPYHPFQSYGQSKSANALFAVAFDKRYRGEGLRAFSLMPGVIQTNLGRHMTPELIAELGIGGDKAPKDPERAIKHKTIPQGAATTVWAAIGPELEGRGGLYLEHCNEAEPWSRATPRGEGVMPHAIDPDMAERLWDISEKEVGLERT